MTASGMLEPRFETGDVYITPVAAELLRAAETDEDSLIARHRIGDWGDLPNSDKEANEQAVKDGGEILSAYVLSSGRVVWVITNPNRKVTTVLLPDER